MLTLIKREIQDNLAYFVAAALSSAILVFVAVSLAKSSSGREVQNYAVALFLIIPLITVLGFMTMGTSQMLNDKTRKVSAFLSTLPVTRTRILLARIITGILAILVVLLPLLASGVILIRQYVSPYLFPHHYLIEIFITVFLGAFACYCLGLQLGLTSTKVTIVLAVFTFPALIISLVVIKGFALDSIILLLLLIAASLVRTWQKFVSSAF